MLFASHFTRLAVCLYLFTPRSIDMSLNRGGKTPIWPTGRPICQREYLRCRPEHIYACAITKPYPSTQGTTSYGHRKMSTRPSLPYEAVGGLRYMHLVINGSLHLFLARRGCESLLQGWWLRVSVSLARFFPPTPTMHVNMSCCVATSISSYLSKHNYLIAALHTIVLIDFICESDPRSTIRRVWRQLKLAYPSCIAYIPSSESKCCAPCIWLHVKPPITTIFSSRGGYWYYCTTTYSIKYPRSISLLSHSTLMLLILSI